MKFPVQFLRFNHLNLSYLLRMKLLIYLIMPHSQDLLRPFYPPIYQLILLNMIVMIRIPILILLLITTNTKSTVKILMVQIFSYMRRKSLKRIRWKVTSLQLMTIYLLIQSTILHLLEFIYHQSSVIQMIPLYCQNQY